MASLIPGPFGNIAENFANGLSAIPSNIQSFMGRPTPPIEFGNGFSNFIPGSFPPIPTPTSGGPPIPGFPDVPGAPERSLGRPSKRSAQLPVNVGGSVIPIDGLTTEGKDAPFITSFIESVPVITPSAINVRSDQPEIFLSDSPPVIFDDFPNRESSFDLTDFQSSGGLSDPVGTSETAVPSTDVTLFGTDFPGPQETIPLTASLPFAGLPGGDAPSGLPLATPPFIGALPTDFVQSDGARPFSFDSKAFESAISEAASAFSAQPPDFQSAALSIFDAFAPRILKARATAGLPLDPPSVAPFAGVPKPTTLHSVTALATPENVRPSSVVSGLDGTTTLQLSARAVAQSPVPSPQTPEKITRSRRTPRAGPRTRVSSDKGPGGFVATSTLIGNGSGSGFGSGSGSSFATANAW